MNTFWRVAIYEYQRNVFKKSFILLLLSVPFFIVLSIGMGMFMERIRDDSDPVGYVDHAGVLANAVTASQLGIEYDSPVDFIPYASEEEARAVLETGEIQAYYVLPAVYPETLQVELVHIDQPGENVQRQFHDFLQINILSSQPSEIARRVAQGTSVNVRSLDGLRLIPDDGPPFGLLMPLFITMAFLFMILMTSGYTMSAVADEKENRTMEVLITSIPPGRLIGGKIIGIVAIGLTLLITWTLVVILGIVIARQFGVEWFNNLSMDWRAVAATIIIAIPTYALAVSLMTAIGAMVTTVQEGQSVSAIFFILLAAPIYTSAVFIKNPHTPLAVTLSLLPFTALMTIGMRNLFTIVPGWQVLVSVIVQTVCVLGGLWLAGRALQVGILQYGQRLNLRKLLRPAKFKEPIS